MTITAQTLLHVTYVLNAYIGSLTIIVGLIGNILNILIFTQLKLFRKNPSIFSLIVVSIADCCLLLLTSITRVTPTIFKFNLVEQFSIACKIQIFIARLAGIVSICVVCFAAFDQYLSTSYRLQLRQLSSFKLAQRFTIVVLLLAIAYSIPVLIYFDIRPGVGCRAIDPAFSYFNSFIHYCILFGLFPIVVALSFSLLAFYNVRHLIRRQIPVVRRRLDRQLTAMILVRAALMIIVNLPFFIYITYQYNSSYDRTNQWAVAVNQFIAIIFTTIFYFNPSVLNSFDFSVNPSMICTFFSL